MAKKSTQAAARAEIDKILEAYCPVERHRKMLDAVLPCRVDDVPETTKAQLAALRPGLPRVIVPYLGGTAGMLMDEHGHLVPTNDADRLLKPLVIKGLNGYVQVVWYPILPVALDSTNARWVHWATVGNMVKNFYDYCDGYCVVGGTDTKAELAAAGHFMFSNLAKAVIPTGGQKPIMDLGDDTTNNLTFAILAAASGKVAGFHVAFGNKLMHGLEVHKQKDRDFDAFACAPRHQIGHFDGDVNIYDNAPRGNLHVTSVRLEFDSRFREGVITERISTATPTEQLLEAAKSTTCQAMLLTTFGAGNTRDQTVVEGEITHIRCLRLLHDAGYPVVLGSPMQDGVVDSPYRSGALSVSTEEDGGSAISAGNTTGATLDVKMCRALADGWNDEDGMLNRDKFRASMARNHCGELMT